MCNTCMHLPFQACVDQGKTVELAALSKQQQGGLSDAATDVGGPGHGLRARGHGIMQVRK